MDPCIMPRVPTSIASAVNKHLLRFLVAHNVSFASMDDEELIQAFRLLQPDYKLPSSSTFARSLLVGEFMDVMDKLQALLQQAEHITLSAGAWTDFVHRSILPLVVVFPDRTARLLEALEVSAESHTAEYVAEQITSVMTRYGITKKVALLVTDEAANMKKARQLIVNSPACGHILEIRCNMHAFGLLLKSLLAHPWARGLAVSAQKVVTYTHAAHQPLAKVRAAAKQLGIRQGLASSNKTRMTSTHLCTSSVSANQPAFSFVLRTDPAVFKQQDVVQLLRSHDMWDGLDKLNRLLDPISRVIKAVQGDSTTLADVTRYWLYLAKSLGAVMADLPSDYQRHIMLALNRRAKEMDNLLCRLALLLDPRYRAAAIRGSSRDDSSAAAAALPAAGGSSSIVAGGNNNNNNDSSSTGSSSVVSMQQQLFTKAAQLAHQRGFSREETIKLLLQLSAYCSGSKPFDMLCDTACPPRAWWQLMKTQGQVELADLAILLLDVVPHAAQLERTFSRMGWYHSQQRTNLGTDTNKMLTAISMDLSSSRPKKRKISSSADDSLTADSADECIDLSGAPQFPVADGSDGQAADDDEAEEVAPDELDRTLAAAWEQEQQSSDGVHPPNGFSSWTAAVQDAIGAYDEQLDLMDPSYKEQLVPAAQQVQPAANFDPAQLVLEHMQRQQAAQQQQMLTMLQQQQLPMFQQQQLPAALQRQQVLGASARVQQQ